MHHFIKLHNKKNRNQYIQANKDWLAEKSQEYGVKALPKGVYYKVLAEGEHSGATPTPSSVITAHYTGKTIDGATFDSSRGDVPLACRLRDLIECWIIAMQQMRIVGKGNPFDAYGHEVAPRTKHLMTGGPYGLSRNPMLVGIYIYDAGVLVWLWSAWPLLIVFAEVVLLTLQVRSEEKRLEKDFGQEYLDYKKRVGRYLKK